MQETARPENELDSIDGIQLNTSLSQMISEKKNKLSNLKQNFKHLLHESGVTCSSP